MGEFVADGVVDGMRRPAGPPLPPDFGSVHHQGDFGEQFVVTIAVAANLRVSRAHRDDIGVDWHLNHPGRAGTKRYPGIEVQVKTWSTPRQQQGAWRYPLRVHNFNTLAGRDYQVPRFLFLVVVPRDPARWLDTFDDRFVARHAAYWACLHDREPVSERPPDSTVTVSVPTANRLDVPALHGLFAPSFQEMLQP